MNVVRLGRAGREKIGLDGVAMEEANFEVMGRQVMGIKPAFGGLGFGGLSLLGWRLENGFTVRDNLEPEQVEELVWLSRQPSGMVKSYFTVDTSIKYSDELASSQVGGRLDWEAWVGEGEEEGMERMRRLSKAAYLRGGIFTTACAKMTRTRKPAHTVRSKSILDSKLFLLFFTILSL